MDKIFKTMSLLVSAAVIVACGKGKGTEGNVPAEEELPSVDVQCVTVEDVPQTGVYTSVVEPYVKNNIAPQTVMRIKDIKVEVGDFVKAGQIVAEMDAINLNQTRLQMVNDSIEFSRLEELYRVGGLAKSDLDAMELKYNVSRTTYENMLENTVLLSPIDGVVTARNYDRGDMFSMSQPIYTVEQITPVKLYVAISESDYTKVHVGDDVTISAEAFPGKTFYGKVNRIHPTIDPSTHTFTVEIVVKNPYKTLRPGMYVKVTVEFGVNRSVVVPDAAIVKQVGSGDRFVYILNDDNTVTYQKVIPGKRMSGTYEILSGIEEGAKVVISGQVRLKSGIKVSVKEIN